MLMAALVVVHGQAAHAQGQSSTSAETDSTPSALVNRYCVTCHSQRAKDAGLDSALKLTLDDVDFGNVAQHREALEKVVRRLRAGMMPPRGAPRPDREMLDQLATQLENELDRSAIAYLPPPGLHRLNRTEYANAVGDLLALDIDPAKYLPSDDSSYGFDNMAGTLGLSSTLVEAYVLAADKLSRLAVGEVASPHLVVYRVPEDSSQDYHIEGLPFWTRGGILTDHIFPSDGEYTLTVIPIFGDNMSPQGFGSIDGEKVQVLIDGETLEVMDWIGNRRGQGVAVGASDNVMQVRFRTAAGPHTVGVTFLQTNLAPVLDLNKQFERKTIQTGPTPGFTFFPHVGSIRIEGPFDPTFPADSPSRQHIFVCDPASEAEQEACALRIVTNLGTEAFRRPLSAEDIDPLMEFYRLGRTERDFDYGIEMALARILASPKFLYRIEAEPPDLEVGESYRLNDAELASRLSYFLWSTGPDAELREMAAENRLRDPAVLEQQVRRMLADPRSEALAVNFAGQWLNLRGIASHSPLATIYPNFDDPLRQAMRREVELLFDSIVREDRSVADLLDADYTFVNERLAKHYGIPNVYGSQFRRVSLDEQFDIRRGLLGKGAILTTTSKPDRTSPVTRGKWIMTNLLGVSPPDPPPDVPALPPRDEDARGNGGKPSMRQQMMDHQVRQDCIQCHTLMDPIGFALGNFDGNALWRTEDAGNPIDAAGILFDNTPIDGPVDLREWLVGRSGQFVQIVAEKLLTYALGRGVEYQDMPVVRSIARAGAENENRFSALVLGVVTSDTFRMNAKVSEVSSLDDE